MNSVLPQKEQRVLKLFKSSIASCQYHMKNGKTIYFRNGKYATDDEAEIAELTEQANARHPHIRIDKGDSEITEMAYKDPLAGIKAKAIEEFLASQRDMGSSDTPKNTGIATSASLAALKANSNSSK